MLQLGDKYPVMVLKDNRRQGTMINGRNLVCMGTTMIVMGMVALAAGLVLQKQLPDSKCKGFSDCIFQLQNVKAGISCGVPIVFYGLFTVLVGICRNKAMVLMLALLSVLSAAFALTILVISEVNIVSNIHQNMSTLHLPFTTSKGPCSESFKGRPAEVSVEPQITNTRHGVFFLRFSSSNEAIQLEQSILRGDHDPRLDQKSATMNNGVGHNNKYQHEPSTNNGNRRAGSWPENAEERGRGMDWNRKFSGEDSLEFEEMLRRLSAEASSNDGARITAITTRTSETREAEKTSYESSGFGDGFDDDEDSFLAAEERREEDEYDSYSELEEGEGNNRAEGQRLSDFENWYEHDFSGERKKRDWNEDCPEDEETARRWLIQLIISCLMAVVGVTVLVLSIVTATLAFSPFCCYQKDRKTNAQRSNQIRSANPATATWKDEGDVPLLSDDESLLHV